MGRPVQIEHPERLISHPFADIFPLLSTDELRELAEDIRRRGLREPIVLLDGKILDGRNRRNACLLVEADLRFEEYDGHDPLGDVISWNLKRRHLNESARAMAAAAMHKMAEAQTGNGPKLTVEAAARQMNVSPTIVKEARAVLSNGSEEVKRLVNDGSVKIGAAAKVVRAMPPAEQKKLADKGAKAIQARAADLRKAEKETGAEVTTEHGPSPFAPIIPSNPLPIRIARIADLVSKLSGELTALLHQPDGERFADYVGRLKLGWVDHLTADATTSADGKPVIHTARFVGLTPLRRLLIAAAKEKKYGDKRLAELLDDPTANVLDGNSIPADEPEQMVVPETL